MVINSFKLLPRIKSDYIGSIFYNFSSNEIQKGFLDWFGMIRIGSDTDIGLNRNSSDWLGMNSYPILSPGSYKETYRFSRYIIITYSIHKDGLSNLTNPCGSYIFCSV